MNMGEQKQVSCKSAYLYGFLGSLSAIAVLSLLTWVLFLYRPGGAAVKKFLFMLSPDTTHELLSEQDIQVVMRLYRQGVLISPENLLSATMQYYDTLIVIITIIMSVIGLIAFMFIRASSLDHVEDMIDKATAQDVSEYFRGASFEQKVSTKVQTELEPYLDLIDNAAVMETRLNRIDDRVEALEEGASGETSIVTGQDKAKGNGGAKSKGRTKGKGEGEAKK